MKNQQQMTRLRILMGFVVRVQISFVAVAVLVLGSGDVASLSA